MEGSGEFADVGWLVLATSTAAAVWRWPDICMHSMIKASFNLTPAPRTTVRLLSRALGITLHFP